MAAGLSLLVLLAICLHWWHPGQVIAQDDNPPLITPGIWFLKSLGVWSNYNSYFGQIDGSYTFAPFMVIWWAADTLFGSSLGQIITHFLLLAATWAGAFRMARALSLSVAAATVAAWLYTINPFTQLIFGNNLTEAMFFGLLAWIGFWIAEAAVAPNRRPAARLWLIAMTFGAMPVLGVTPSLVFQIALDFVVVVGFCALAAPNRFQFFRWASGCAGLMVAAGLWWAVPDVASFLGATIPHPTALADLSWTYTHSSLLNDLRFLYTWLWGLPEYYPSAAAYDANPVTYAAGFLAIAASAFGLIVLRGKSLALCRYALTVALAVMFVAKGSHPPLGWLNAAFAAVPGMFLVYADPEGEVALALLLLALAASLVFDSALWLTPRFSIGGKMAALGATLAIVAMSGIALISGAVFHGTVVSSTGELMPSDYVSVPAYWQSAADYINHAPPGGVLMLPPHLSPGYDVAYNFGYYGVDAVATNLVSRRLLYLDAGLIEGLGYLKHAEGQAIADRVRDLLTSGSPLAEPVIKELGIRYVLFRNDIVPQQHDWHTQGALSALFGRTPAQFGPLAVYDLGPPESAFALRPQWIAGDYGAANPADLVELGALEEPLPRLDLFSIPAAFAGRPVIQEQSDTPSDSTTAAQSIAFGVSSSGVDRALRFSSELIQPRAVPTQSPAVASAAVIAKPAAQRELRVSLGVATEPATIVDIPPAALLRAPPTLQQSANALLAALPLSIDDAKAALTLTEAVENFGARAMWSDVLVPILTRPDGTYVLKGGGFRYRGTLEPSRTDYVVRFRSVIVPPGETTFEFSNVHGAAQRISIRRVAFASASQATRPNSFYFAGARAAGAQFAIGKTAGESPGVYFASSLGSVNAKFAASDHVALELVPGIAPLPMVTAVIDFVESGRAHRCPSLLPPGVRVDLDYAIAACFRQNLAAPPRTFQIGDVEIVATAGQLAAFGGVPNLPSDARVILTAQRNAFAQALPALPEVTTNARLVHFNQGRDGFAVADFEAPAPGSTQLTGAVVTAQSASGQIHGTVTSQANRVLSVQKIDQTVAFVPYTALQSIAINGYREPVTMHWSVAPRFVQRNDFIVAHADGCELSDPAHTSLISVSARAGGKAVLYQQQLFPDAGGLGAGLSVSQMFGSGGVIRSISIRCASEIGLTGLSRLQARLAVLRRAPASIDFGQGRGAAVILPRAGVLTKAVRGVTAPLAVRFGDLPPQVSIAALGAPPAVTAGSPVTCESPAASCTTATVSAAVPRGFKGVAIFNQLYSPTWIAVEFGPGVILPPHTVADGWRNAWYVAAPGRLIIFNLLNVFAIAGLLLGLVIIVGQLRAGAYRANR